MTKFPILSIKINFNGDTKDEQFEMELKEYRSGSKTEYKCITLKEHNIEDIYKQLMKVLKK